MINLVIFNILITVHIVKKAFWIKRILVLHTWMTFHPCLRPQWISPLVNPLPLNPIWIWKGYIYPHIKSIFNIFKKIDSTKYSVCQRLWPFKPRYFFIFTLTTFEACCFIFKMRFVSLNRYRIPRYLILCCLFTMYDVIFCHPESNLSHLKNLRVVNQFVFPGSSEWGSVGQRKIALRTKMFKLN